jgi:hypothetical protein
LAEVVSLNRKEFMQWWVEDFEVYVMNAKTSMLNKMCVDIQLLLNAIEDDEEAYCEYSSTQGGVAIVQ